jgi:hypothetical protein
MHAQEKQQQEQQQQHPSGQSQSQQNHQTSGTSALVGSVSSQMQQHGGVHVHPLSNPSTPSGGVGAMVKQQLHHPNMSVSATDVNVNANANPGGANNNNGLGWRVKLYRLNADGSWDDCGTGRISCHYSTSHPTMSSISISGSNIGKSNVNTAGVGVSERSKSNDAPLTQQNGGTSTSTGSFPDTADRDLSEEFLYRVSSVISEFQWLLSLSRCGSAVSRHINAIF